MRFLVKHSPSATLCGEFEGAPAVALEPVTPGPTITPNGTSCTSGPAGELVQFQARGTAPAGMSLCVEVEGGTTTVLDPFGEDRFVGSQLVAVPSTIRWRVFASGAPDCSTNGGLLYPGPNLDMQVANTPFYTSSQCVADGDESWLEASLSSRWSGSITSGETCPSSDIGLATRVEFRAYNLSPSLEVGETMCLEFSGVSGVPVPLAGWRYTTTIPLVLPSDLTYRWYVSADPGCSTVDRVVMPGDAYLALAGYPIVGDTCVVDAGTSERFLRVSLTDGPAVTASGTLACTGCFGDECVEDICDNGSDDDGDELVDCADPDCDGIGICGPELCDDGEDNDGAGDIDCLDADCSGSFACGSCVSADCADADCSASPACAP